MLTLLKYNRGVIMNTLNPTKDQILRELGDLAAKRNNMKPKDARRALMRSLKKASYDQWLAIYKDAIQGGK